MSTNDLKFSIKKSEDGSFEYKLMTSEGSNLFEKLKVTRFQIEISPEGVPKIDMECLLDECEIDIEEYELELFIRELQDEDS